MAVKQIELELTTDCNASCPQCSRNFYGGPRWPSVPQTSMNLVWLQDRLPLSKLKELELIRLCGTYGDPCVHPELIDIVNWIKSATDARVVISTNGGMRSNQMWKDLASVLDKNDMVIFGIDGLADTNHLYRRGVDFNKVIDHAQNFISAGGRAVWQFIAFEHNQHQIEEADKMSKAMGFEDFVVKKTTRFVDKRHDLIDMTPVVDYKKIYFLRPPTDNNLLNPGYKQLETVNPDYRAVEIDCLAQKTEMIYVGADGYVFPCGFLADRLYGHEAETHADHNRLQHLFKLAGGAHKANLEYTDLNEILSGWFNTIKESWTNECRLDRCAHQCGKGINLVTDVYSYMRGKPL